MSKICQVCNCEIMPKYGYCIICKGRNKTKTSITDKVLSGILDIISVFSPEVTRMNNNCTGRFWN